MVNLNKNHTLELLQNLIQENLATQQSYLPESFNIEQRRALELFKKRVFLEKVIEETVDFNRKLNWDDSVKNLHITRSAEELIEVFKLRSDVYDSINYLNEFPDTIEGLNFDVYDTKSAVIYYRTNGGEATGTSRIIFDSENGLPTEGKCSFDYMREKYNTIGEISRLTIKNPSRGLSLDFKNLMRGIYNVFLNNDIDITLSGIKKEHYKLYSKFGGVEIEKEMESYGSLTVPFLIISYNPGMPTKFFHRSILN